MRALLFVFAVFTACVRHGILGFRPSARRLDLTSGSSSLKTYRSQRRELFETETVPDEIKYGVRLELYTRDNPDESELIKIYDFEAPQLKHFNAKRPTKVAIHGWMTDGKGVLGLRRAFLQEMDVNFILVNWTGVDSYLYLTARWNVEHIGRWVGYMLDFLVITEDLKMSDVHLIGHSLGAHISGFAGAQVRWGAVSRISGLDPAGPFFDSAPENRLSTDDAVFVDVIHTCANVLGYKNPIGHVDFYPNQGKCVQPGCVIRDLTRGTCSHNRAYDFYQESIIAKVPFKAWPCEGMGGQGNLSQPHALMGLRAKPTSEGAPHVFCLRTASESPFALTEEEQRRRQWEDLEAESDSPWYWPFMGHESEPEAQYAQNSIQPLLRKRIRGSSKEVQASERLIWQQYMSRGNRRLRLR